MYGTIRRSQLHTFDAQDTSPKGLDACGYNHEQGDVVSKFKKRAKKADVTLEWFERKTIPYFASIPGLFAYDGKRMYGLIQNQVGVFEFVHVEYLPND